ncbi:MAG TPA: response regulator [Albitalea sp.]
MARILVIDDDAAVRDTIARVLRRAGHEVDMAENGVEGIRAYRRGGHTLVITDLYMPEKEGIETIMELRAERPDLPILAVSGGLHGDITGPLIDAELIGANATLAKPFTNEELQAAVERLLAGG